MVHVYGSQQTAQQKPERSLVLGHPRGIQWRCLDFLTKEAERNEGRPQTGHDASEEEILAGLILYAHMLYIMINWDKPTNQCSLVHVVLAPIHVFILFGLAVFLNQLTYGFPTVIKFIKTVLEHRLFFVLLHEGLTLHQFVILIGHAFE